MTTTTTTTTTTSATFGAARPLWALGLALAWAGCQQNAGNPVPLVGEDDHAKIMYEDGAGARATLEIDWGVFAAAVMDENPSVERVYDARIVREDGAEDNVVGPSRDHPSRIELPVSFSLDVTEDEDEGVPGGVPDTTFAAGVGCVLVVDRVRVGRGSAWAKDYTLGDCEHDDLHFEGSVAFVHFATLERRAAPGGDLVRNVPFGAPLPRVSPHD